MVILHEGVFESINTKLSLSLRVPVSSCTTIQFSIQCESKPPCVINTLCRIIKAGISEYVHSAMIEMYLDIYNKMFKMSNICYSKCEQYLVS